MIRKGYAVGSALYAVVVLSLGCATAASIQPPAVQSGYAPVNGLKMYYEIYGRANGKSPPLVLLHGGGSTIETSFGKVLPGLAKNRQVIAFEQQGHGHTADIVDRPFTFEQSAEDTAGLLRYLNIGKADFFGYSNGGHIALQMASATPTWCGNWLLNPTMFDHGWQRPRVLGVFRATRNWKTCPRNCGRLTSEWRLIPKICQRFSQRACNGW